MEAINKGQTRKKKEKKYRTRNKIHITTVKFRKKGSDQKTANKENFDKSTNNYSAERFGKRNCKNKVFFALNLLLCYSAQSIKKTKKQNVAKKFWEEKKQTVL